MTYPFESNRPRIKWLKVSPLDEDELRNFGFVLDNGQVAFAFMVSQDMLLEILQGAYDAAHATSNYTSRDIRPEPITIEGGQPRLSNEETSS